MNSFSWMAVLEELHRTGESAVMVTVSSVVGSAPREVGAKMIVLLRTFKGTIGGGKLEDLAIDESRKILNGEGQAKTIHYSLGAKTGQCCGGTVDLLFEPLNVGPRLHLFGAGHVGQAICQVIDGTPFQTHLIDDRAEWRESSVLNGLRVIRHDEDPLVYASALKIDRLRDFVLILTHSHDLDEEILRLMLKTEVAYLGLIGSRSKWQRFHQRLSARGIDAATLARVRCPIGLPIGGKTPKEIAISVASELIGIWNRPSDITKKSRAVATVVLEAEAQSQIQSNVADVMLGEIPMGSA